MKDFNMLLGTFVLSWSGSLLASNSITSGALSSALRVSYMSG